MDNDTPSNLSTADAIRNYVNSKYPSAQSSPLANAFRELAAKDQTDAAIDLAKLKAKTSEVS